MERVYVENLPKDISIRDIDDFFRPFGKLAYIDMHIRNDPVFAFIQFDVACDAYNAVRERNGYDYEGYTLQVKLVEKSNDRCFEVRNPCEEETPPPPPMFNDLNNQSNQCEFSNNVSTNPSAFLQSKLPSGNMELYSTGRHSNVASYYNLSYPTLSRWSGISSSDVSNRRFDGFTRTDSGSNRGVNDVNCYNDNYLDSFENIYTEGLSDSGRILFNHYIRKGFAPKIAREKAVEERTVPYPREVSDCDDIFDNHVSNFSKHGSGDLNSGGDCGSRDFSNKYPQNFNMAGRSSSNYDKRSSTSRRSRNISNREGQPKARKESGVLDKKLIKMRQSDNPQNNSGYEVPLNNPDAMKIDLVPQKLVNSKTSETNTTTKFADLQSVCSDRSGATIIGSFIKMKTAEKRRFKKALAGGLTREQAIAFAQAPPPMKASTKRTLSDEKIVPKKGKKSKT